MLSITLVAGAAIALAPTIVGAQADPPEVDTLYAEAMDAFARGDYETAAGKFDEVVARTTDAGRRATATELASQSRTRIGQVPPPPPDDTTPGGELGDPAGGEPEAPPTPPTPAPEADGPVRDGRFVLLLTSTVLGLSYWGLGVASLATEDRAAIGLYLLTASVSFFGPFVFTMNNDVTWGSAALALYGGFRGPVHATLLMLLFDANIESAGFAATTALFSLGEFGLGYGLATALHLDAGTAHSLVLGHDVGMAYVFGIEALVAGSDLDLNAQTAAGTALLGAIGGSVASVFYDRWRNPTWGDAEVVNWSTYLGIATAADILMLAEATDVRAFAAILLLGGTGGLVVGDQLARGYDIGAGEALIMDLASIAGALAGGGLAFVAGSDDPRGITTVAVLGALAGYGVTYVAIEKGPDGSEVEGAADVTVSAGPYLDPTGRAAGVSLVGTF